MINDWFEVWADDSGDIPYLLLVKPNREDPDVVTVYDPAENYKAVFSGSYEEAKLWLAEDEYTRVSDRVD
jgi:hypothetical protein